MFLDEYYDDEITDALDAVEEELGKETADAIIKYVYEHVFFWGHRGCRLIDEEGDIYEENTLHTISLAIEEGCLGVEIDVWGCQDGLVVTHDFDFLEGKDPVSFTVEDLKQEFGVISLIDVLELLSTTYKDQDIQLNIEIKDPPITKDVLNLVTSDYAELTENIVYSSFYKETLDHFIQYGDGSLEFAVLVDANVSNAHERFNYKTALDGTKKLSAFIKESMRGTDVEGPFVGLHVPHTVKKEFIEPFLGIIYSLGVYTDPTYSDHPYFDSSNNLFKLAEICVWTEELGLELAAFLDTPA